MPLGLVRRPLLRAGVVPLARFQAEMVRGRHGAAESLGALPSARSEGEEASLMEAEDIMASWYAPPSDKWRIFGRKDFAYFVPGFRGNTINSW